MSRAFVFGIFSSPIKLSSDGISEDIDLPNTVNIEKSSDEDLKKPPHVVYILNDVARYKFGTNANGLDSDIRG
jgi:hypothetical protein